MGWKGTMRSINAACRAAERESQRRYRELQRQEKEFSKMQVLEQAAYEFERYESTIDCLLSVHKECFPVINWTEISAQVQPQEPQPLKENKSVAELNLENYKSSWFDRLLGLEGGKRRKFAADISRAIVKDKQEYDAALARWTIELDECQREIELARGILNNDPETKLKAIEYLDRFADITELGSRISFAISHNLVECTISIRAKETVPVETKACEFFRQIRIFDKV